MAPQFVKPYVKSNKNDAHDAAAICEAVTRPSMRFVPIKEVQHQDMQMLHRIRSQAVKQRTALSNQARGFLLEYGIPIKPGLAHLKEQLPFILEDGDNELSTNARALINELYEEFKHIDERLKGYDQQIAKHAKELEICQRLMKIEGIGPLTATILWATVTDASLFKNGRHLSAMLGLVPKQSSSGNKMRLHGISKRGDRYVRT
jgi:transposase